MPQYLKLLYCGLEQGWNTNEGIHTEHIGQFARPKIGPIGLFLCFFSLFWSYVGPLGPHFESSANGPN